LPDNLQAELRHYQQQGLNWLQFLREYKFGGILADDMGLGKTIQALAHLLL
jgi:SNF2 family DNA or RNA helicase